MRAAYWPILAGGASRTVEDESGRAGAAAGSPIAALDLQVKQDVLRDLAVRGAERTADLAAGVLV